MTALIDTHADAAADPHPGSAVAPRRHRTRHLVLRLGVVGALGGAIAWALTGGGPAKGPKPLGVARLALGDVTASAYLVPRTDGTTTLVVGASPAVHLAVSVDGTNRALTPLSDGVGTTVLEAAAANLSVTTPDGHTATARVALPGNLPSSVRTDDPDAWLGHALSGRVTPGPTTSDDPAADGRALVAGLVARGVRTVAVLPSTSDRGTALTAALVTSARAAQLHVDAVTAATEARALSDDALIVTGERADASRVLSALAGSGRTPLYGVWMAPWLFDRAVLDSGQDGPGRIPPPSVFVLPVDPFAVVAQHYLAAVVAGAPGQPTTYDGLLGWIAEHPDSDAHTWRTYVAGDAAFLPQSLNAGHDHGGITPDWITSGGVNAASSPLTVMEGR